MNVLRELRRGKCIVTFAAVFVVLRSIAVSVASGNAMGYNRIGRFLINVQWRNKIRLML